MIQRKLASSISARAPWQGLIRERKFIVRGDNNKFEITCNGVEEFEAEESNYSKKQHLTLPAPAQASA